ncbi:MAG: catalase family peroxidase [Hyphomicrobium sp.]|uniref:catalase family peroxidase n=1 Tax=Hyphomicrobium sp. TaxID=82 RepID=UPI001322C981|nr:catalase family peroxidase [Hyphomicrobium sp.]KAB2941207.1 MAG: catalase family peroxidase [Hyphomicrobium sp.]MBZ0209972.1 catalase family peroxidase [Hyphomicrobium sp.]
MRSLCFGIGALSLALLASPAMAQEAQPEQLIDALNAVFGAHAKMRAAHTKGICVKGNFTPTAEAAALSKAPLFAAPVPLVGRFSLGGGNPAAPDNQKDNVRGIALHFQLPDGGVSDLVMVSAPIFVAKTPEQFLELLTIVAGKDKDKLDAFFKANPETTRQGAWLKARPTPASYATADYYGVHTFALINAKGDRQPIKWKAEPVGGFVGLSDQEAEGKGMDFYAAELNERFAKGPAEFNLYAVLGQPGDQDDDPTSEWPADRKSVKMGTISITGLENDAACDVAIFDPNALAGGIEASKNDKILPMRSLDYAVSFGRRTN